MEDVGTIGSVIGNADFVGMTYALKTIGAFAKDGWTAIVPEIQYLINGLVRLSIVLTAAAWVWRGSPDSVAEFLWMAVKLNVVLWFINDFWSITSMIFDAMVGMGIASAPSVEGAATTEILKDPGAVAGLATIALTPLMKHIDSMLGPVDVFWYATELLFAYGALICGVAVFLVFGLLIFLAAAEFYIMAIPAAFMAPFIAWNKTAFIATPAIAYIVNTGIRLFGTTVVVVMGLAVMLAYKWPEESTVQDSVNILILTIAILGAGLSVFKKLTGLVNGGPTADVGSAIGSLYYAARLGSAAGKEAQDVMGGIRSGGGPVPRALSGFVNGVRGGGGPGTPGAPGAGGAANSNGGVRGAFQRGLAGARANIGYGGNSSQRNSGIAGAGSYGTHGQAAGVYAFTAAPSQASPPSSSSQASTASAGASQASSGGGTTQQASQATPGASGGSLASYQQDMRDQQAHYDGMANDPAIGSAVADSLRADANRGLAIQAAEHAEITDPAKGQAMYDQISRVDGRVDRATQAGRPANLINQKSAAEYRDIVLNA